MLFKFEIGRKLAGLSRSRFGFLITGVIIANLYLLGKTPWLKDRLASLAIISEKKTKFENLLDCIVKWVTVVTFWVNDGCGDGTGCFKIKDTAKFTNVRLARFTQSRYLFTESKVFIENKTDIVSRMTGNQRAGMSFFSWLLFRTNTKKFGF